MLNNFSSKIRAQFPILKQKMYGKNLVYLDNAATTQKPVSVINAEKEFYETTNANIHRGVYELSEKATEQYVTAHQKVAKFIGARSFEEIIFTKNTTEAINLVAQSLPRKLFGKNKKILVSIMEHHSNLLPWQRLARETGTLLEFIELTEDGRLDLTDLRKKLTRQTTLLAVTHVSNVLGAVNPIEEIVKMAHKAGALVLVDAAQSVARLPINVKKMDADFLAFSAHKMYGPLGIGVLYGKKNLLEQMTPFLVGGDMVQTVTRNNATWNVLPWKFEAGTPNIAGGVALSAAIDFVEKIGLDNIWQHEQELVNYVLPKLAKIKGLKVLGLDIVGADLRVRPRGNTQRCSLTKRLLNHAGVISFTVDKIHSHDLVTLLDAEGIAARGGQHCAQPLLETLGLKESTRISFSVTTTTEELDKFLVVLKKSIKLLQTNE